MIAVEERDQVPEVAEITTEGKSLSKKSGGMLFQISREERRNLSTSLARKNRSVDASGIIEFGQNSDDSIKIAK